MPSDWLVQTPRLRLRLTGEADRAQIIHLLEASWPLHRPWVPLMPEGQTFADLADSFIDRSLKGQQTGEEHRLLAYLADGRLAAMANLFRINRGVSQSAYCSWSVSAEVAGQGYATEAVEAMLDYAFARQPWGLGLHRVQANIIPRNAASNRVAQKTGFRLEGLALRYLCIAGNWEDHSMYAKLAEEHVLRFLT